MDVTDVEQQIRKNLQDLVLGFKMLEGKPDYEKQIILKELTKIMQECKRQLKDFEREARTESMPPKTLAEKKRNLVQELNAYIAQKKAITAQIEAKSNLMDTSLGVNDKGNIENTRNSELMRMGRQEMLETDAALERSRRQLEETIQIGAQAASSLADQTKQMEGILDDLDDITFNMKKAQKVIAEITRSLISDKCVLIFFFFIVLAGVSAIVGWTLLSQRPANKPPPPPVIPGLENYPPPPFQPSAIPAPPAVTPPSPPSPSPPFSSSSSLLSAPPTPLAEVPEGTTIGNPDDSRGLDDSRDTDESFIPDPPEEP